eukprot:UN0710
MGDNFIEQELLCGDYPVGIKSVCCKMRVEGIMAFTLVRQCMNSACCQKTRALLLFNDEATSCKKIKAHSCCAKPMVELTQMSARLLHVGEETYVPIAEICFPFPACGKRPARGTLQVVCFEDAWVALQGPAHDFYKCAQDNMEDRALRVDRLEGDQYDQVYVHIDQAVHESLERISAKKAR